MGLFFILLSFKVAFFANFFFGANQHFLSNNVRMNEEKLAANQKSRKRQKISFSLARTFLKIDSNFYFCEKLTLSLFRGFEPLSENDQVNARRQVYQHAIGSFDWLRMLKSGNGALNRIMAPRLFLLRVAPPIRFDRRAMEPWRSRCNDGHDSPDAADSSPIEPPINSLN